MKMKLLSLTLAVALLGAASSLPAQQVGQTVAPAASVGTPDPVRDINNLVHLFRAGDLAGLAQGLMPRTKWEEARLAFEVQRHKPTTEAERAHFAEKIQQLTAPDAVDQMMLKLEPQLAKARPQMPGMLLMAFGAMQVAVKSPDSKLTDTQRAAIESVLPGLQHWASNTDFLNSDTLRHALTLISDAARHSGITDIDQLKALPLEGALERASPMLAAAKQAVRSYGIDLDAIADSMKVEVLDLGKDTAHLRTTITLFGAPVQLEYDVVLVEGHWYGKHAAMQFDLDDADDLAG